MCTGFQDLGMFASLHREDYHHEYFLKCSVINFFVLHFLWSFVTYNGNYWPLLLMCFYLVAHSG